jgi:NTP pyrophosphatase (non-canonical NTP hydrolase)
MHIKSLLSLKRQRKIMKKLIKKLIKFRDKRNWKQFHSGFALSHKLQIESAEVAELFEWNQEPDQERLEEEIADVLIVTLYLCEKYGVNPVKVIKTKIDKNSEKYPAGKKNDKWRAE